MGNDHRCNSRPNGQLFTKEAIIGTDQICKKHGHRTESDQAVTSPPMPAGTAPTPRSPRPPSIFGVPPGYSAARLQHMSQHRGSRFPFSGFRTVISTGHPYTPAPPRSPQLTQPRPRFYRRFPTVSMPQHGRSNPGATHSTWPDVPKVMGVHTAALFFHARMAS